MTTMDQAVQAALAGVAGISGASQQIAPQGTQPPYIVWFWVVSTTNNSLDGASNVQNSRLQVDVFAKDVATRKTIADAAVAAMAGLAYASIQLTSQDLYEPDVKLFRRILEFSIWG